MRLWLLVLFALFSCVVPTQADPIGRSLDDAKAYFRSAAPALNGAAFDIDLRAYSDALEHRRFTSPYWGKTVELIIFDQPDTSGLCGKFAAFVTTPPRNGTITLTLCPQFSRQGSDGLRTLTILHELVHVVAGPDECRAMAFAAQVEFLASGSFSRVDAYWEANKCQHSAHKMP
ncbi:hypothetical protein JHL21_11920 [Devosia sp. WQ 349]|uniref:hypothetical protein n=1 Tax=Devosia sp. WQ 349K1 TaxID=2800329 RepID=UPI00190867EA|nr:hypothetical protein [Devosia sp. WQ 349K1]MBK1795205.1 hypothetical protein [Devosia sp. WQ 349K1]